MPSRYHQLALCCKVMNDFSLLLYILLLYHVGFGGHTHVDMSRTSANSGMLNDFINDYVY